MLSNTESSIRSECAVARENENQNNAKRAREFVLGKWKSAIRFAWTEPNWIQCHLFILYWAIRSFDFFWRFTKISSLYNGKENLMTAWERNIYKLMFHVKRMNALDLFHDGHEAVFILKWNLFSPFDIVEKRDNKRMPFVFWITTEQQRNEMLSIPRKTLDCVSYSRCYYSHRFIC